MHLDEGRIQQWLDGEVSSSETEALQQHTAQCNECRGRIQHAEQSFRTTLELLRHLDHSAPNVSALELLRSARAPRWGWVSRAAALFLVTLTVGGVAWGASGGGLPAWVGELLRPKRNSNASTDRVPPSVAAATVAGVSVSPGSRFSIQFTETQTRGSLRVSFTNNPDIVVRAPLGAATFTSGETSLVIANPSSTAEFELEIPQSAPWVEIRVKGGQVFLKRGESVSAPRSLRDAGLYVIPLFPSRPE